MEMNRSARELLDRYLLGVKNALPVKKREDIAAEIESSLLDRMDERFSGVGEISEEQVKEVLTEMGSPRKVAASYGSQRGLIGPGLFPSYLLVLRIVVLVVIGALTLAFLIGTLTGTDMGGWKAALNYVSSLFNGAFMAAAWVTLVFAIIERASEGKELAELQDEFEKFKPEDLPNLNEDQKKPSTTGMIADIVASTLGLLFFTYLLGSQGSFPIYINPWEKLGQVQIFTDNFLRFVPAMMAIAGVEIARNALHLVWGRRTAVTDGLYYLTEGAHIVLSAFLLGAFPLISLEFMREFIGMAGWNSQQVQNGVDIFIRIGLILSIFGSVVNIIKRIVKTLKGTQG